MNDDTREWATGGAASKSWLSSNLCKIITLTLAIAALFAGWYAYEQSDLEWKLGKVDAYGPLGHESWPSSFPEAYDLRGDSLISSAKTARDELPVRDCLVVIKNGAVIHEEYYNGGDLNSAYDVEEVGKIASVLAIGTAVHKRELSLDDKVWDVLKKSGSAGADEVPKGWNKANFRELTIKQLIAQVGGSGDEAPGSSFSNDAAFNDAETSPLNLINGVLRAATGESPVQWLKKHLTGPIGLPNFFAHDSTNGDISAVGGQMASCRDLARFGQLIINGGLWRHKNGSVKRIVSEKFIKEMFKPSFPHVVSNFGFGGWVYNPKTHTLVKEKAALGTTTVSGLGQDCPVNAGPVLPENEPKYEVMFSTGGLGKMMITIPSERVIVVSLGNTWSSSVACPAVNAAKQQSDLAASERSALPRNDLTVVQRFWSIIKPAVERTLQSDSDISALDRRASYASVWSSLHHRTEEAHLGDYNSDMKNLVDSVPVDQVAASKAITKSNDVVPTWEDDKDVKLYSGKCSCRCAPNLKIGQCFTVKNARSNVCEDLHIEGSNIVAHGARFCPALGVVNSCSSPGASAIGPYMNTTNYSSEQVSSMIESGSISLINKQVNPAVQNAKDIEAKIFSCKVTKECKSENWENQVSTLQCGPTGFSSCSFVEDAECDSYDDIKLVNTTVEQGLTEATVEMPEDGWILQNKRAENEQSTEGGDLGVKVTYSRLRVSGRTEKVHLLKQNEGKLVAFNALVGLSVIIIGFVIVGRIKRVGKEGKEGDSLVSGGEVQYGTDSV